MALVILTTLLAALVAVNVQHGRLGAPLRLLASHPKKGSCFGAAALDRGASCPSSTRHVVPEPSKAGQDRSAAYDVRPDGKDCWSYHPDFPPNTCHFGDRHGKVNVVLAGNSHAGQWLPALARIAARRHWRITAEMASQCSFAVVTQMFPEEAARSGCRAWSRRAARRVRHERPDLIVFTNRMSLPARGHTFERSVGAYAHGIARVFRHWRGIPVMLIRDTPVPGNGGISVPGCLMAHPDRYAACNGDRSVWVSPDPGVVAAKHFANVHTVNLNDHLCRPKVCPAVVGGVIPYLDGSHLTATYVRTLTPYLEPLVVAALHRGHRR